MNEQEKSNAYSKCDFSNNKTAFMPQYMQLKEMSSNDLLLFVVSNRSKFLSLLQEKDTDSYMMSLTIIALGKACTSDQFYNKTLNKLMITISSCMNSIVINLQRYFVLLIKQQLSEQHHLDALLYLTEFLKAFHLILPSSSLDSISILLPSFESTCDKILKNHNELYSSIKESLKLIKKEQGQFLENLSLYDEKKLSHNEKLQLEEPPENFRILSILPTADDVELPCSFLRPNLVKGRYRDAEHYLDVQFRLLREDYVKPLRDGVSEYKSLKKKNQPVKNCKNVRVYCDVIISMEEFIDGDLLHTIKFRDKFFYTIKWEHSKRLLTGNLLCFSVDDFRTMLFATVIQRDPKKLRNGLLLVKFVDLEEKMQYLNPNINYVVIELSTLLESYRHNLKVLQQLDDDLLPMKNYIVYVEKKVNKPEYLQPTTVFDMRPLLFPLKRGRFISYRINMEKKRLSKHIERRLDKLLSESEYATLKSEKYKTVQLTDEDDWPSASELKLDDSQYFALKSAITKEFAIIQGPPGTGKTYIGLRIVQLLLHNLNVWFSNEPDSLPILVVCYTNHALDQFLEGISHLTRNIVRIGGRCSNELLEEFQIKSLVRRARMSDLIRDRKLYAKSQIEKIKKKIATLELNYFHKSTNSLFHENILREYISVAQFQSLMKNDQHHSKNARIYEWLEVDSTNNIQINIQDEFLSCGSDIEGSEIEIEDEADIEFTENQRDIEYYDFKDRILLRDSSLPAESNASCELERQNQINKQAQAQYIRNSLQNNPTMTEKRALRIKNVWTLPLNERWQLYKFWLECFLAEKEEVYLNLQHDLKIAFEELSNARIEEDLFVLKNASVIGMTTTGAAKYRHILEAKNPVILIVEEAAEILESHIITSLAPKTKHVILIGDQQQLRPSPTVFALAEKYGMNISLFERMIMNGMDYCRLSLQHRMRPEIAALIVPHIYSDLKNHEIVTKLENVKGVDKNVFFITHNFDELNVQDSRSKVNDHEAKFITRLCKYVIYQGYEPEQITVLTTYSGQLFALKKLAVDEDVRKVRFTVVDNFQGEENDIILISFVRSNDEGNIGFLKVSNRVCVALSRAKKGLYCIGNFELLAQKSVLWKNILRTLTKNKCVGPSLRLICQNHPDVCTDVANSSDFDAVPEGGCKRKCEYRLLCGHSCTLLCHPYDLDHEKFKCQKPCVKVCEREHPCKKICFEDCKPCPVIVEKTLSRCGHTVNALCGKNESDIKCQKACTNACKEGHPCPKKCFQPCGSCKIEIEKTLSKCGHKVTAPCGKNESDIRCQNACINACKEGHPCPKKCFEPCGSCEIEVEKTLSKCGHKVIALCGEKESDIKCPEACTKTCKQGHTCPRKCFEYCGNCEVKVQKILPKCNHTVDVACWESNYISRIKCKSQCNKTCSRNHICQKKCFETCGPCEVKVEKIISSCEHKIIVPCSEKETEIKCIFPCKKKLPCSHPCKNKCWETCEKKCLQVTKTLSPVCGHSVDIECCFVENSVELAKRCFEPCRKMLPCGHVCKGNCSACKQGNEHIICKETCRNVLTCGHLCSNKCAEPCVTNCEKIIQVSSSLCGHLLRIKCYLSDNLNELSKRCFKSCGKFLDCGHKCGGNCASCFQGRLHVSCKEPCNRILICGHKCEAKCYLSCPPCKKPCENRCRHSKCPKKCGDPCVNCVKLCNWSCIHKKCTRRCHEVCNRSPCNEKCLKQLACKHQCVGFCGEPCPRECFLCVENSEEVHLSTLTNEKKFGYVYLEDCKHTIKEDDLRKWLTSVSSELQELKLKTCPRCGTVIRMNLRFNEIIKNCKADIERIKKVTLYDKDTNLIVQRNILKHINESHININDLYKSVIKALSGGRVRDIQELTNVENMMNIATEIELKNCGLHTMFSLTPFIEEMVVYMRSLREWMIDFIEKNVLFVSENQLQELSKEVYRLSLLSFLLNIAKQKHFISLSPEFKKCASSLMSFRSLSDENIDSFKRHVKSFVKNLQDIPVKRPFPQEVVNMSAPWYRCSKDHIICFSNFVQISQTKHCYKCQKSTANERMLKVSKQNVGTKNNSKTLNLLGMVKVSEEKNKQVAEGISEKICKFFDKNKATAIVTKVEPLKKNNPYIDLNQKFKQNGTRGEFTRKLNQAVQEHGYNKDSKFCESSHEKNFDSTQTYKKSGSNYAFPRLHNKNGDDINQNSKERFSSMPWMKGTMDERFHISTKSYRKHVAKNSAPPKNVQKFDKIYQSARPSEISSRQKTPSLNASRKSTEEEDELNISTKSALKPTFNDNFPRKNVVKGNVPTKSSKKFPPKNGGYQNDVVKKEYKRH